MLRLVLTVATVLAVATTAANAATVYRVRRGDTLTQIARTHGTSVARLERLNGIAPGDVLFADTTLKLPSPERKLRPYVVRAGDTLTTIAIRFHTTPATIAHASVMKITQLLLTGATLEIPTTEIATSRVAAAPEGTSVRDSIIRWSNHYGVDPHLATALAWMESGFNNQLVSKAGAVGVMQITPVAWDYVEQVLLLGRTVSHNADGNVRIGVALLHHLLHLYDGNQRLALAAYYQGPRSLQANGPLPDTLQYVADILALKSHF